MNLALFDLDGTLIEHDSDHAFGEFMVAIGWVDADRAEGDLNVAIRTFWIEGDELNFGTGGAITWDSVPEGEWAETELKAANLLAVAAGRPLREDGSP